MKQKLRVLKKRLSVLINDNNRKSLFKIFKEAIIFGFTKKEFPYFYFGKFLYRKEITNYLDYLSSAQVDKITLSKTLHQFQFASLLRNKLAFAFFMEKHNVTTPKLLSYNFGNTFFSNSKFYKIESVNELEDYFKKMFQNKGLDKIFVKSIVEMGGNGCFLFTKENLNKQIANHGAYVLKHDCIHQEVLLQHATINKIYPHSINTIRFDTYIDKNLQTHILSAFMRFGSGGSVIDNGSSGGFYVSVNLDRGALGGKSYQLMKYGGTQLKAHPDTKVVFNNYKIPFFDEACLLVRKAVQLIPDRIIGWDIAITPNGPCIIEGNDNNSFITPDIAYGGYLKHPLFNEILSEA
ncbi:sugar-transfer associated ATP-grasp domain-containing protein [Aquimarina agarivorans]|uniref:sugar-transfer associated ATP-grasp domain-containing protein n=1 Tax=Aquimarina agarivorans TaxID=980584 RepID=UPI000248E7DE|nr:sugar-transfer associated ATP-grasp domain-containing protein [Aquimarina agarivorans]